MTQLELAPEEQKPCEWCGLTLATTRVVGTCACASCSKATPKERVLAALRRWKRGRDRK